MERFFSDKITFKKLLYKRFAERGNWKNIYTFRFEELPKPVQISNAIKLEWNKYILFHFNLLHKCAPV